MRIRKNAKNSKLFYTNANVLKEGDECLLQKNLCQLNQSPWDIITFPSSDSSSSLHQLDDNECYYNVSLAGNGISNDSSGDFDRLLAIDDHSVSVPSVKNVFDGEYYDLIDPKNEYNETLRFEGVVTNELREEITLCDKRDKKGWQCGKVVKNGETVCDRHHILELQNHASCTTKKKPKPVHGPMTGSRPARSQTKKQASTNPYEFYYYSGFGPSWGKKRGTVSSGSNTYNEPTKVVSDGNYKIMETSLTNDEMDVQNVEGPTKMELACKTGNIAGKKRGRKPIKARSLKSLM